MDFEAAIDIALKHKATMKKVREVIPLVTKEIDNAAREWPMWPTDPLHALAILGEEFGELNKEILQMTYEPNKTNLGKVKLEAIQTAAMSIRLLMSLDDYKYIESKQHQQAL